MMTKRRKRGRKRSSRPRVTSKRILNFSVALERAQRALEKNQVDSARYYAEKALEFVNASRNPQAAAAAHRFLAEAHFRLAVSSPLAQEQETHLNAALAVAPQEPRFHFRRAIALFRQNRLADAAAALDKASGHPGVVFVRSLLRLADGQPWEDKQLAPQEANTLRLLQAIHEDKPGRFPDELTQQPLLACNEIWQALLAVRSDAKSVTPEHLIELAGQISSSQAQGILHYYAGVAALSQGRKNAAADAWNVSAMSGWRSPWLTENNQYLGREDMVRLAQEERWQEIIDIAEKWADPVSDRILSETIGTAYFVLGYQAARAAEWQKAASLLRAAGTYVGGRALAQNLALCEEALENWDAAGDAWRAMARRRPRSADHPDSMTDTQVAAIWAHAAECYDHSPYVNEEVFKCLRTAIKYAEDDTDLRMKLVNALLQADRKDAAEDELTRILEIDDEYIPALLRLADIVADKWDGDPIPLFRKILAIEPNNRDAQEGLAEYYMQQVMSLRIPQGFWGRLMGKGTNEPIKLLQQALEDLPRHPRILLMLALQYREAGKKKEASATLQEAYRVAPQNVETVGSIMHELLHLDEFSTVERMVAEVRQLPDLLMGFWLNQGDLALGCELGDNWALRFFEEALLLAAEKRGDDSRPQALLRIIDTTIENEADDLTDVFLERVRAEMPDSGILEYAAARALLESTQDRKKAQRLLRKAKRLAEKAGNPEVTEQIENALSFASGRRNPLLDILRDFGGDEWF